jgi:hypothetical protein
VTRPAQSVALGDICTSERCLAASRTAGALYAGTWRGLEVAIKTVLFEGAAAGDAAPPAAAASEAAIASTLKHGNLVATHASRLRDVADAGARNELHILKLYLVQARLTWLPVFLSIPFLVCQPIMPQCPDILS